jgi:spermidine synthase
MRAELSKEPAAPVPPEASSAGRSSFGLLLLCFFLSGLAALIYQTAWTRQFAFVFGTSELAVASVLAAYMGGLALGAAVVGRLAPRVRRPVLVYGLLELAIGLSALAVPLGVSAATRLYVSVFGAQGAPADEGGLVSALFYLACASAILLVPTSLMGATLPLLARHAVRSEEELGHRIGRLYAMNTAGAVVGTALTGFVLLPSLGLRATVWIAVAANLVVFASAALLGRVSPALAREERRAFAADPRDPNRWILPLIGISGAASFTYEVLWTRLLGHVLGGSVYAFATMLATFLSGIAIGSWLASGRLVSDRSRAAAAFAWAQVGTGLLSLSAYVAIDSAPGWVEELALRGDARLLLDAAISAAILLPATLCIGATFPLAVRVLARTGGEAGPASARVYAWNTVGAIAGAVGAGFFLIPAVGFSLALSIAVAVNAGLALFTALRARPRPRAAAVGAAAVIALLVALRPEPPWQLLRMGTLASRVKQSEVTYHGVGRSATVMLQRVPDGWRLSSNGLSEAVITRPGVRGNRFVTVRWLSNLPAWGRPHARSILVVGFGGGLVVEAVPRSFERVHVVEIEPEIIRANAAIAGQREQDPLSDPRLTLIINDARGALLLTRERYDAIVSQPSHPWTASASHLYTREFFELVRAHLSDDGVFVQWMGLGFVDEALLETLVATLLDVFPHVRVYRPAPGGLLFTASPVPFEPERAPDSVFARSEGEAPELGVRSGLDVVAHMLLDDEASRAFARDAPISTDDRNWLQMSSPRIVREGSRLDPDPAIAPHDPLAVADLRFDRAYLVRRMLAAGMPDRAERVVAAARKPVEQHVGRGLLARARGDRSAAIDELRKAIAIDPKNAEARMALLRLVRAGPGGAARASRFGSEPTPVEALVLRGWDHEQAGRFSELRALEPVLADVAPRHPAYLDAAGLRVAWRMADRSRERAGEALAILDEMLPLGGSASDLLTRAVAAARAGYPAGTRASLAEFTRKVSHRDAAAIRDAIAALDRLPDEVLTAERRARLARQLKDKLR